MSVLISSKEKMTSVLQKKDIYNAHVRANIVKKRGLLPSVILQSAAIHMSVLILS